MTVSKEAFKSAIRRGGNPAGSYEGLSEEDKTLLVAEVKAEDRGGFKAALAAAKAAQIAEENARNS